MTGEQYERISAPFRGAVQTRVLTRLNQVLTYVCYLLYPVLLAVLAVRWDGWFWRALLVPAISFLLLSLVRKWLNWPRPYQVLDIQPLIHKDTQGKSMPSRHVFSVFVIAMTYLWVMPWAGVVLLALGALMAVIRVIGGVHFPRDVLVGAAVGVLSGLIGYWWIP
ncbi:MAG: phosphatase PAP2 family protein [Oscillospiraceae bacterium]|nr:phosphatase PAP2 family protein [Oscillospiraceae bacterium]